MRAAVIGAGPAGFYTTDQLLAAGFEVDLFEALPTPFGLVRSGVAPDHPKIKSVSRVYEKTAAQTGLSLLGGVMLGRDISPRRAARALPRRPTRRHRRGTTVWGFPARIDPARYGRDRIRLLVQRPPRGRAAAEFDLGVHRAVVIGNGNVAIDVARMLVLDPSELSGTDTADHVLEGRRGGASRTS